MDRRGRGYAAERAAERLLRRQGLVVLARNWRGGGGELDLAALDGDTIVFVEVKSRAGAFLEDRSPVGRPQRRRIAGAARAFRRRYGVDRMPFRFDLVTVRGDPGGDATVLWDKSWPQARMPRPGEGGE